MKRSGRKFGVICDLDGVLHRGEKPIKGADKFINRLQQSRRPFIFLTNSPEKTPEELSESLIRFKIHVPPDQFLTAGREIVQFITCQTKRPTAFLIGNQSFRLYLKRHGIRFSDKRADFVIVATGGIYGRDELEQATRLVLEGARLIVPNAEPLGLKSDGVSLGCGALVAPVETAAERKAYIVGKPNHLMVKEALRRINRSPHEVYMIGDSMDTDVHVGFESGMKTILVLSGLTKKAKLARFVYRPDYIFRTVNEIDFRKLP